MRKGKKAGSENWAGAILTIRLPPLIQWRSERCMPPFRGEGWGKRSLQSALRIRFGVSLHPEPHL